MTPQAKDQLRAELKRNLQVYRGWVSEADAREDLEHRVDELAALFATHLQSIRDAVEAEMPEKCMLDGVTHTETAAVGSFNEALAQCKAAIAKGFETAGGDTPQGKEEGRA